MNNALLNVQQLRLRLSTPTGRVNILRGIDFHLHPGEIVGLVGESGCGKSLMASALMQLFPFTSYAVSGQVLFEGQNLLLKSEKEMQGIRGKRIGYVFQDPSSALNPTKKIGDQLSEGLMHHDKLSKQDAHEKSMSWLQKVGISDPAYRMRQYPHELSGGMKQRILIAMALACNPSLLIADEPTTALDVTIQAQILELLKERQKEQQLTLLLITHDLGVVANCCDRMLVMHEGQIVEAGSVKQLLTSPSHAHTQALLEAKKNL